MKPRSCSRVIYDGDCAFCRTQVRRLQRLDWCGRLEFVPSAALHGLPSDVTEADLAGAIHVISPEGRVFRAARAFRALAVQVPLLAPVGWLLWVPGLIFPAEIVYRWISRHRHRLGRCNE
jgi:predicted DCC family thiol-disulfide oxidoreductase YuxK